MSSSEKAQAAERLSIEGWRQRCFESRAFVEKAELRGRLRLNIAATLMATERFMMHLDNLPDGTAIRDGLRLIAQNALDAADILIEEAGK